MPLSDEAMNLFLDAVPRAAGYRQNDWSCGTARPWGSAAVREPMNKTFWGRRFTPIHADKTTYFWVGTPSARALNPALKEVAVGRNAAFFVRLVHRPGRPLKNQDRVSHPASYSSGATAFSRRKFGRRSRTLGATTANEIAPPHAGARDKSLANIIRNFPDDVLG